MANSLEAYTVIMFIGLSYAIISLIITSRFGNRVRVKEIQAEINRTSKNYQEALKKGNEAEKKAAEADQQRMPVLLKESMILQFKPLVILLPFLLALPALVRYLYPDFVINLPFSLPIAIQNFERFPNWRSEFGAVGWFWLSFLFSSLTMQASNALGKMLKGKGRVQAAPTQPEQTGPQIIP